MAPLPPLQTPARVAAPSHPQAARVLVMAKTVALLAALTAAGVQGFASRAEAGGAAAAVVAAAASASTAASAAPPPVSFRAAEGDDGGDCIVVHCLRSDLAREMALLEDIIRDAFCLRGSRRDKGQPLDYAGAMVLIRAVWIISYPTGAVDVSASSHHTTSDRAHFKLVLFGRRIDAAVQVAVAAAAEDGTFAAPALTPQAASSVPVAAVPVQVQVPVASGATGTGTSTASGSDTVRLALAQPEGLTGIATNTACSDADAESDLEPAWDLSLAALQSDSDSPVDTTSTSGSTAQRRRAEAAAAAVQRLLYGYPALPQALRWQRSGTRSLRGQPEVQLEWLSRRLPLAVGTGTVTAAPALALTGRLPVALALAGSGSAGPGSATTQMQLRLPIGVHGGVPESCGAPASLSAMQVLPAAQRALSLPLAQAEAGLSRGGHSEATDTQPWVTAALAKVAFPRTVPGSRVTLTQAASRLWGSSESLASVAETGSEITSTAAAAFTAAAATTAARDSASASASIAAARAAAAATVAGSTPRPSQAPQAQAASGASWSSSSHSGGESLPEPQAEAPSWARAAAAVTVEISFADDCDVGMWSESGPLLALVRHGASVRACGDAQAGAAAAAVALTCGTYSQAANDSGPAVPQAQPEAQPESSDSGSDLDVWEGT